ncbi:uncharacterized protein LOC126095369 [Schistocerca cancellata]|uniref:uncharacterized protein LOC126095369 n=1 Tax=Schistocerca cancellata TaxID=274614 RepID=UPI00211900B1|nr:uncharacterized protein LOC126095369 [Schistocerca cancellata]
MSSYRPVSLVSGFSKIIEKAFLSKLITFFDKNNIISGSQHGFRPQRSTETATFNLINHVLNAVDNNRYVVVVVVVFRNKEKNLTASAKDITKRVSEWFTRKWLIVNPQKTILMNFHTDQNKNPAQPVVCVDYQDL